MQIDTVIVQTPYYPQAAFMEYKPFGPLRNKWRLKLQNTLHIHYWWQNRGNAAAPRHLECVHGIFAFFFQEYCLRILRTLTRNCLINLPKQSFTFWITANTGSYLTYWDRDKMVAILQTTCSNAFSSIKMFEFRIKFHWSLFLRCNWQYDSNGSGNGLSPNRRQTTTRTNDDLVQWRIYVSSASIC